MPYLILGGGLGLLVLAAYLWWRIGPHKRPGASRSGPVDRLIQQIEAAGRRAAILAVTTETSVEGLDLTALGEVWVRPEAGQSPQEALAEAAVQRHPKARVVTGLSSRLGGDGREEWGGMVCAARPRDYRLMPAKPQGPVAVLVDGSNVVNWEKAAGLAQAANLNILSAVVNILAGEKRSIHIICNTDFGVVVAGRFMSSLEVWEALGKPKGVQVTVIDKDQIADQALIDRALKTGAEIVTNDGFREHPAGAFLRYRRGWSGHGRVGLLPLPTGD